jgi:hypothetical protein
MRVRGRIDNFTEDKWVINSGSHTPLSVTPNGVITVCVLVHMIRVVDSVDYGHGIS